MAASTHSRLAGIALAVLVAFLAYRFLATGAPHDAPSERRAADAGSSSDPVLASSLPHAETAAPDGDRPTEIVGDDPSRGTRRLFGEVVDGATGKPLSSALVTAIRARYGPTPGTLAA